jgi:hypothetical protein
MTDDRLTEIRDLIATATHEADQLRDEQLQILPSARASKASTTALAAAFGMSRAAFYKNGYDKAGADIEGDPIRRDALLERIRELESERAELVGRISELRRERDTAIVEVLTSEDRPTWTQLSSRAGVSTEWISRLKNGRTAPLHR